MNASALRSVAQIVEEFPAFDERFIRRLIFHASKNGLAPAIVHVGRRVFIDRDQFDEWLEARREGAVKSRRLRD